MRATKPLILFAIIVLSCVLVPQSSAESQEVCCDSSAIDLYLIGADGSEEMTPFDAELAEESEEKKISDAIAQPQEIASEIDPSWPGEFKFNLAIFDRIRLKMLAEFRLMPVSR